MFEESGLKLMFFQSARFELMFSLWGEAVSGCKFGFAGASLCIQPLLAVKHGVGPLVLDCFPCFKVKADRLKLVFFQGASFERFFLMDGIQCVHPTALVSKRLVLSHCSQAMTGFSLLFSVQSRRFETGVISKRSL